MAEILQQDSTNTSAFAAPAVSVRPVKPETIRLPAPGARCPYTGLSRSTLAELCTPCEANGYKPPVKSGVIKKRNAIRGIRVVFYDSLMAHLASLSNVGIDEEASATLK